MDLKDMVLSVVYQSHDGLSPVEIVKALARQFGTQTTSKQVLQIVNKNPKLFVETDGKIKSSPDYFLQQ